MRGGAGASRASIMLHDVVLSFPIAMEIVAFFMMIAMFVVAESC
jgi:hypothetical protein